jgi:hypothetical protein
MAVPLLSVLFHAGNTTIPAAILLERLRPAPRISNGRVNGTLQAGCSGNLSAALVLTPSVQMPFSAAAV